MPPAARLVLVVLIGLAGAPAAWAQGCCLSVRPAPAAPSPTIRLDAIAPTDRAAGLQSLADPFGQSRPPGAALPFLPSTGGAGTTGPGVAMTLSAPVNQGGGTLSLSLGVRSIDPGLPGPYGFTPPR